MHTTRQHKTKQQKKTKKMHQMYQSSLLSPRFLL